MCWLLLGFVVCEYGRSGGVKKREFSTMNILPLFDNETSFMSPRNA